MGAPIGNQNGAKSKQWTAAIERALARMAGAKDAWEGIEPTPKMRALDELADIFVQNVKAGDLPFFKEFGDRIEGKAAQQIDLGNANNEPFKLHVDTIDGDA